MNNSPLPPWDDSAEAQLTCFSSLCGILRKEMTEPPAMAEGCAYHILVRSHYDAMLLQFLQQAAEHYCRAVEDFPVLWLRGSGTLSRSLALPFGRYSSETLEATASDRLKVSFEGWAAGEGCFALSRQDHRFTDTVNGAFSREMCRRSVAPVEIEPISTLDFLPLLSKRFYKEALPVLNANLKAMSLGSIFDDSLPMVKVSFVHRRRAYFAGRSRLQQRLIQAKPVLVRVMMRAMNTDELWKEYSRTVSASLEDRFSRRITLLEEQSKTPEELNLFGGLTPCIF